MLIFLSHSRINFLEVLRISCLTLLITRVIITLFTFKIFLPKTGSRFLNLTSDQFFSNFSPQRGKFLHHDCAIQNDGHLTHSREKDHLTFLRSSID